MLPASDCSNSSQVDAKFASSTIPESEAGGTQVISPGSRLVSSVSETPGTTAIANSAGSPLATSSSAVLLNGSSELPSSVSDIPAKTTPAVGAASPTSSSSAALSKSRGYGFVWNILTTFTIGQVVSRLLV